MILRIALTAVALVMPTPTLKAQTPQFLSPADAARLVADGKPWNGVTAEGRKARITLNKDGSGSFEGPITLSIRWEIKQDDLCLNVGIVGTKCLRFRQVAGGFEGWNAKGPDLSLTR